MSFTSKLALFNATETSKIADNIIGVENQIIEKIELKRSTTGMEHGQEQSDLCKILNTDSLMNIFDYLKEDDLCAVVKTCRKLREIAGEYFRRKYLKKLNIEIRLQSFGDYLILPRRKHATCFMPFVRSASIFDTSFARNAQLPLKLRQSLDTNFKEIAFHDCNFTPLFITQISEILQNVERITFHELISKNNSYDNILKHCQKLKYLNITCVMIDVSCFPIENYPTIEYFECKLSHRLVNVYKQFLRQNPQLKTVVCHLISDGKHDIVRTVLENAVNIEELYLNFGQQISDLDPICHALTSYSESRCLKRIELKLSSMNNEENTDALTSLKMLTGLHLTSSNLIDVLLKSSFDNLNILQLQDVFLDKGVAQRVAQNVPNLTQLYLSTFSRNPVCSSLEPFACFSIHLRSVVIFQSNSRDCIQPMSELNKKRKKLINACVMNVYIADHSTNVIKSIKSKPDDRIVLKVVEIFRNGNLHMKNNPMIRFTYNEL